jgi:hypothetical protein
MVAEGSWQEWLTVTVYLMFTLLIVWRVVVGQRQDDDGSADG